MQNTINSMNGLRIDMDFPSERLSPDRGNSGLTSASITAQPSQMTENFSMRSSRGMAGLIAAENGASMVEIDAYGNGSGFKEGRYITPETVTPLHGVGKSKLPVSRGKNLTLPESDVHRRSTLLSRHATSSRNAAELNALLGNSRARVKAGASVCARPGALQTISPKKTPQASVSRGNDDNHINAPLSPLALEQGKTRSRVEIDIALETSVCVEGGHLNGHIHVKVNKPSKKDSRPVCLSEGKLRIAGFEVVPRHGSSVHPSSDDIRHIFYQAAYAMKSVALNTHYLYTSPPDDEGFAFAREGAHGFPFSVKLPSSSSMVGCPKGVLNNCSGAMIRYIVIASIKLKDPESNQRSVAHFYRNIEIWPLLSIQTILQKAPTPLQSTSCKTLFMGGPGPLKLTALLHRRTWIAGQRCYIRILVENESKKTVKSVSIALLRTLVLYRPRKGLGNVPERKGEEEDPDACQTVTSEKVVAETILTKGQKGAKGLVSAKGWWTGVESGESASFTHDITLPVDAHTVPRSRLLEVEYAIRVSLCAGSLSSEVSVSLPIKIVNFISLDPPPSAPMGTEGLTFNVNTESMSTTPNRASLISPYSEPSRYSSSSPERVVSPEEINYAGRGSYLGRTMSQPVESRSGREASAVPMLKSFRSNSGSTKGRDGLPHPSDPFDKIFPWRAAGFSGHLNDLGAFEDGEDIGSVLGDDHDIPGSSCVKDKLGEGYITHGFDDPYYYGSGAPLLYENETVHLHDENHHTRVANIDGNLGSDEELQLVVGSARLGARECLTPNDSLPRSANHYNKDTDNSRKHADVSGTGSKLRTGSAVRGPRVPKQQRKGAMDTSSSHIPAVSTLVDSSYQKTMAKSTNPSKSRKNEVSQGDSRSGPRPQNRESEKHSKHTTRSVQKPAFASRVNGKLQAATAQHEGDFSKSSEIDVERTPKARAGQGLQMHNREGASIEALRNDQAESGEHITPVEDLSLTASFTADQKSLVDGILKSAAITSTNYDVSRVSPAYKGHKATSQERRNASNYCDEASMQVRTLMKAAQLSPNKPNGGAGDSKVRSKIAELELRVREAELDGRPDFNRSYVAG